MLLTVYITLVVAGGGLALWASGAPDPTGGALPLLVWLATRSRAPLHGARAIAPGRALPWALRCWRHHERRAALVGAHCKPVCSPARRSAGDRTSAHGGDPHGGSPDEHR